LIADSLGGAATQHNLITGTRTQNVGSTRTDGQYNGGMAAAERIARDYLDSDHARDCPLYYAATANYHGNEFIPRSVTVDLCACDRTVDLRIDVSNTAFGWDINYHNAEISLRG